MIGDPEFVEFLNVRTGAKRKARRGTLDAVLRDGESFAMPVALMDAAGGGGSSGTSWMSAVPFGGYDTKVGRIQTDLASGDRMRREQAIANASGLAGQLEALAASDNPNFSAGEKAAAKQGAAYMANLAGQAAATRDSAAGALGARDAATVDRNVPIDTEAARNEMIARLQTAHQRR